MEPDDEHTDKAIDFNSLTDEEYFDLYGVPRQDTYTCLSCRKTAYPPSETIDLFDLNAAYIEFIDGHDSQVIICFECIESGDWEDRARANLATDQPTRPSPTIGHRLRGSVTARWSAPEAPPSLLAEHWLFVRRLALVLTGVLVAIIALVLFTGLSVWLLDSPAAGVAWITGTAQQIQTTVSGFVTRPSLLIIGLGIAYLAHLESVYTSIEAGPDPVTATRPRWHFVAIFATVGTIGGVGWALTEAGLLTISALPVVLLLWSGGALGLVYALHVALLEDRWSYGLRYDPARWKFPVQFGIALTIFDGLVGLPWSPAVARTLALVPPVVGLLYIGRRYLSFSAGPFIGLPTWARGRDKRTSDPSIVDETALDTADAGTTESRRTAETIAAYEADIDRLTDQLDRMRASAPDRPTTIRYADLFRLKEDLDRALDVDESLRAGVETIAHQVDELLAREGIEPIETTGQATPFEHKIVDTVTATDHATGEIVDVYRPGFRLGDRVLQEAHVVVAADLNED